MRIFWLSLFAMIAFAANSVLTRFALAQDQISPAAFVGIRLVSGAVMLMVLVRLRGQGWRGQGSIVSATMLMLYAAAFSFAYVSLDAGIGALILFGGVQLTMFAGALILGEKPSSRRWLGMGLGMSGLAILFAPGAASPDLYGAVLMAFSAMGWGIYSLRGKSVKMPLQATALNFLIAAPFGILIWVLAPQTGAISAGGIGLAILSGAVASGIGYAVWYAVLPKLDATMAAIIQLTVPILALLGGFIFLGETATTAFLISSVLILAGVALAASSKG